MKAETRHRGRLLANRLGFDIRRGLLDPCLDCTVRLPGLHTVLDIGANAGQYARNLRAAGFRGRIVSCEPSSEAHRRLVKAAARDPRWTTVRTALGATAGPAVLRLAGNSESSSVLDMLPAHRAAAPAAAYVGSEPVPMATLDQIAAEHSVDPAGTLVKIDVQGLERPVLDGAGPLLDRLTAVQLELSLVPLYAGQELMPELTGFLGRHGFELWAVQPGFRDPDSGRTLQCDGLFVRR